MKPGSCTLPMYGIDTVVLDAQTGEPIEGNNVEGVLAIKQPWPGELKRENSVVYSYFSN